MTRISPSLRQAITAGGQYDGCTRGPHGARQLRLCRAKTRAGAIYAKWRDEPLVVDKWFGAEAGSRLPGTVARVRELTFHPAFTLKNPNKVYALLGSFGGNSGQFPCCGWLWIRLHERADLGAGPDQPSIGGAYGPQFRALETVRAKAPGSDESGFGAGGSASRLIKRNHRSSDQVTFLIYPHILWK